MTWCPETRVPAWCAEPVESREKGSLQGRKDLGKEDFPRELFTLPHGPPYENDQVCPGSQASYFNYMCLHDFPCYREMTSDPAYILEIF